MAAQKKVKGFTLIEMLLVMVIIGIIIVASMSYIQQRALQMRMDRTSTQMQQILNAALAFYVANGYWPSNPSSPSTQPIAVLQAQGYLPNTTLVSPWGTSYNASYTASLFSVWTRITVGSGSAGAYAEANIIAGSLPLSYTSTDAGTPPTTAPNPASKCSATSTTCGVVSSVNIPGQNLNNATAVNFAGLYNQGGCVPVPQCPVDALGNTMTPQVMIVPVSVSGLSDPNSTANNVYPISSFSGYAQGNTPLNGTPPSCDGTVPNAPCPSVQGNAPATQSYWRACLKVITEKGDISVTNPWTGTPSTDYGPKVTVMAITRCSINNAPAGSQFQVYSN